MIYLTDDTLSYLSEIILDYNGLPNLSSLITCHKLKLIINKVVNNKLKQNYYILIRNNNSLNPLRSYDVIYKIYHNKFILNDNKINNLILSCINSNNIELIEILRKTIYKSMNSDKIEIRLLNVSLECENDNIDERSLSKYFSTSEYIIINYDIIIDLFKNYYNDIIKFKTFIKNLSSNKMYENILKRFCMINDDINILKLLNKSNIDDVIQFSLFNSNENIMRYIKSNNIIY